MQFSFEPKNEHDFFLDLENIKINPTAEWIFYKETPYTKYYKNTVVISGSVIDMFKRIEKLNSSISYYISYSEPIKFLMQNKSTIITLHNYFTKMKDFFGYKLCDYGILYYENTNKD